MVLLNFAFFNYSKTDIYILFNKTFKNVFT